ncbi:MAG: TSUP family transporter [Gemmobacter sp.]
MPALAVPLPPLLMALAFLIVAGAAAVQAGLGFGFGLAAAPLLALMTPDVVPGPVLWVGLLTSIAAAWADRAGIVWPEVWLGSLGRLVGVVIAVAVMARTGSGPGFQVVFGGMVGCAVVLSLVGRRLPSGRGPLVGMATVSGVMGTITGVGAPPMAMVYQGRSAAAARPTLAAFFSIGVALSLAGLHLGGLAGWRDLWLALLMVPPMLLGTVIGRSLRGRIDTRWRLAMLVISATAAVVLILRGIVQWAA